MELRPDYPIRTERLLLRPYGEDDYEALAAIQSRDDVHTWLYSVAGSPEEIRRVLEKRMGRTFIEMEEDVLQLAIELQDGGTVVGDVLLALASERHRQGEIGFILHPDHQGRGYAREVATEMLRLGFEVLGLHRIYGRCEVRNEPSAALMRRLGMRLEAHLVENEWVKDEWQSELVFAMLQAEWK
jgi:RimJ/RimL family protein N-acetyltransferase